MGVNKANNAELARAASKPTIVSESSITVTAPTQFLEKGRKQNIYFARAAQRVIKDNTKRKGDKEIMARVLDEIEAIAVKRMSEGFNKWNFSVGVFNCFFIVYVFGEHYLCLIQMDCVFSHLQSTLTQTT